MKKTSVVKITRLRQLVAFAKTIDQLKTIERVVYLKNGRRENDAEHTWHLVMLLMLFANDFDQHVDIHKVLKLALIHDLPEIYAGDTFFFSPTRNDGKKERELKAAKKLFGQLPKDLKKEYLDLFDEYEKGKTSEAKLVQAFDKLNPMLQNIICQGRTWKEKGVTLKMIDELKRYCMTDPISLQIYDELIKEIVANKITAKEK